VRRRVHRHVFVAIAIAVAACATACGDPPSIARDAPAQVAVGGTYRHALTVRHGESRDVGFVHCGTKEFGLTEQGAINFFADKLGSKALCAEIVGDGNRYDKYEWTVQITGVPDPWRDDPVPTARRAAETWRARVERGLAAAKDRIANPGTDCASVTLAVSQIYDESLPDVLAGKAGALPFRHFLSKPFRDALAASIGAPTDARKNARGVKEITSYTYALYVLTDAVRQPRELGFELFQAGSFTGQAAIVDLPSGKVLCRAPLAFRSSRELDYTSIEDLEDKEKSSVPPLEADFAINGIVALRKAFEKRAPRLRVLDTLDLKGGTFQLLFPATPDAPNR
jgi:hypothetical protein